jgi:hypothetical protein
LANASDALTASQLWQLSNVRLNPARIVAAITQATAQTLRAHLSGDQARRIAANIAKLPQLVRRD